MAHATKIATCCYCGTRAALVLTGKQRHELACSGCGAPLHDLKFMPVRSAPAKPDARVRHNPPKRGKSSKRQKKKKRKGGARHFLGEAFDLIEDIFD